MKSLTLSTVGKTPTLLIDADLFLYRAACIAEEATDWGDDIWSLSTDLKIAKSVFTDQINSFYERLKSTDSIMCLSDSQNNFRKQVCDKYKSNRRNTRKPVGYKALVKWCESTFVSHRQNNLEADDVMGILGSNPSFSTIIVSDDKDLKTVPCTLYRPASDELMKITVEEADSNFYAMTLQGDSTDGFSGCPKVGAVTARRILGTRPDWSLVEKAFVKAGLDRDHAIQQARLARILRMDDYNLDYGVQLYEPPRLTA